VSKGGFNHLLQDIQRSRNKDTQETDKEKASAILDRLFPQQRAFVLDPSRQKAALCPRRSGKSYSVLSYALIVALSQPGSKTLIICKVRRQARGVYWNDLKRLSKEFELGAHYRNMELECELPNGSLISFTGADTTEEIEKFRGQGYDLVCIDEGKSYSPALLKELIQDVIKPALLDRRGTLVMIGTPGAILSGAFYEITTAKKTKDFGSVRPFEDRNKPEWKTSNGRKKPFNWSLHRWHSKDNIFAPWIWTGALADKVQAGWPDDHPTWVREYLGKWVPDDDALVYMYSKANMDGKCNYHPTEEPWGLPPGHEWHFLLGLDLGYHDDTAFVVAAWSPTDPNLYYIHAEKHTKWTIEQVAFRAKELEDIYGGFMARIADTGGLAKMLCESMAATYGVHFEAAKKTEKHAHIKLLNSDLEHGRIKLPEDGALAEEYETLQWAGADRKLEDPACANHAADAALYIWRYAYHHLWEARQDSPTPGTPEWWKHKVDEEERAFVQQRRESREKPWWGRYRNLLDKSPVRNPWTSRQLKKWSS
jgi:hypothetical protein